MRHQYSITFNLCTLHVRNLLIDIQVLTINDLVKSLPLTFNGRITHLYQSHSHDTSCKTIDIWILER